MQQHSLSEQNDLEPQVREAIENGRVVEAVKLLRQYRGIGLKQAKGIVDEYRLANHLETPRTSISGINVLLFIVMLALIFFVARDMF